MRLGTLSFLVWIGVDRYFFVVPLSRSTLLTLAPLIHNIVTLNNYKMFRSFCTGVQSNNDMEYSRTVWNSHIHTKTTTLTVTDTENGNGNGHSHKHGMNSNSSARVHSIDGRWWKEKNIILRINPTGWMERQKAKEWPTHKHKSDYCYSFLRTERRKEPPNRHSRTQFFFFQFSPCFFGFWSFPVFVFPNLNSILFLLIFKHFPRFCLLLRW